MEPGRADGDVVPAEVVASRFCFKQAGKARSPGVPNLQEVELGIRVDIGLPWVYG